MDLQHGREVPVPGSGAPGVAVPVADVRPLPFEPEPRSARPRPEGQWRHGEIYVFVETMELSSSFHAASPEVEGRDRTNSQDANGVLINQKLRAATLDSEPRGAARRRIDRHTVCLR